MIKFSARDRLKLFGGGAASLLLSACGGGSSSPTPTPAPVSSGTPTPTPAPAPAPTPTPVAAESPTLTDGLLKNTFANDFNIGCILSSFQLGTGDINATLGASQFNSLTPSFQLKADVISPTEGEFNFEEADRLIDWAIAKGMDVRGHALVWHEATPDYFYEGTRAEIRARLETYVRTVVEHFRGRITVWDVANEVVSVDIYNGDNGVGPDRDTPWFQAVGNADYIDWAFRAAREADPDALLFLNDYETENPLKREWLIEILQRLQDRGVPIDGVGQQFHLNLRTQAPDVLAAVDDVDNQFMGLIQHVTELDVSYYNDPGTCWAEEVNCDADIGPDAPADMLATQARLLRDVFAGLRQRPSVESVTSWGVTDGDSWLNAAPTERFNHALLFDRAGEPKPALWAIVDPDYVIPTE